MVDLRTRRHGAELASVALVQLSRGNVLGALAAWRSVKGLRPGSDVLAIAGPVMALAEGRGRRDRGRPARPTVRPPSAAWALAWAGDLEGVRRFAEDHPDDPSATGLLGVVHVLERKPAVALRLLDQALTQGSDAQLELHRVRALLHLRRFAEAREALGLMADGESLGRRLLVALDHVLSHDGKGFHAQYVALGASETHLNGLFSMTLPAIVGEPAMTRAFASPDALGELIEGLLDRMAGNLGLSPTTVSVSQTGERRFAPLVIPRTEREAANEALRSLPYVGAGTVLSELGELLHQHPGGVHARCYRGELYLWLGRYDDAWRDFDAANQIEPARWVDIGKVAVLALTGRSVEASMLVASTATRFPPIVAGTLPVYQGVMARRSGRITEAIEHLDGAVLSKPTRTGARMELCLALRTAGRRAEAAAHAGRILQEIAPVLVHVADARGHGMDWWRAPAQLLDDDILEEALVAMRGNRSSSLVTWIDSAGELRIIEPLAGLVEHAETALLALDRRA